MAALPGTVLASGDGTVWLWDPTTGRHTGHYVTAYPTSIAAVALPHGRTLLAIGTEDGTVDMWDPARGDIVGRTPSSTVDR